jgi:type IV secretion system protein VirB11
VRPGERPLRRLLDLCGLAAPLADPATTEVVVNRPGEIGVERDGAWTWHAAPGATFERLETIGVYAAHAAGAEFDEKHPLARGTLPDGERLQACRPKATRQGVIALTVRKPAAVARRVDDPDFESMFSRVGAPRSTAQDAALLELKRRGQWREFWKLAVRSRRTIGACGATGSGKTDFIKRLLQEVPEGERIVTAEDADEFGSLRQRNHVALFFAEPGQPGVSAEDCVRAARRMRPDRIMLQECRGPEAFAFVQALAAGHPGGMTSWHAEEGEAFDALELMLKQHPGAATLPDAKARSLLRRYLDLVVWLARGNDGFSAPQVWVKAEEDLAPCTDAA